MKTKKFKERGITLIALVITIIVLLILAGVTLSILLQTGIIENSQRAVNYTKKQQYDEEYALQGISNYFNSLSPSENGYNEKKYVNSPKITKGMIPVKWENNNWVVCSQEDDKWYNYGTEEKLWANVMLSDEKYKADTVEVGTIINEKDLGSMYVWIPRYAYKMPENSTTQKGTIEINFLKGNTNKDKNETEYPKSTADVDTEKTAIVHPAFTIDGKELTGIWVAKFEMSGKNSEGKAVGNATKEGNNGEYNPVAYEEGITIAQSLPNVPSWRNITIGESEYQSIAIAGTNKEKYGIDYCSSHLIKNSEWGAVSYLCYSNYGEVPQINACGSVINGYYYDLYTGQGPNTTENKEETRYEFDENTTINEHGYSTANGMLASTTGNITGIYDMNGGSWERVAAYLNNGNENLDNYGKSTSNTDVKYFENGKVKSEYSSLWEGYEVSEEEKNNKIKGLEENEFLTQTDLWKNKDNTYNSVRKRITDETFELLKQVKGIGVNEVANSHSYYGKLSDGIYQWFTDAGDTTTKYGRTWNSDLVLIGHASFPFVLRGGGCGGGSGSGVLCSDITYGFANYNQGFRAVLVV